MNRTIGIATAALVAVLCLGAAPKPTPTPKAAPARPAATTRPAKTAPKAAAKKTAPVAKPVPSPTPDEPAVMDGERKVAGGEASWKLGKDALDCREAEGTIQTSSGFKIASLVFPAGKTGKLQIEFMYTGSGPVNDGYLTKLFVVDGDGRYHAWRKGVSDCTVTLAKGTAYEVEGTAHCPKGLLDSESRPAKPITEVKFHAKAETAPK